MPEVVRPDADGDLSGTVDIEQRGTPPSVSADAPTPAGPTVQTPPAIHLPLEAPPVLARSETARRRMAAIGGVVLGMGVSLVVFAVAPATSALSRLFDLRTLEGILPIAILAMFFWGALLCVVRARQVRAVGHVGRRSTVASAARIVQDHGVQALLDRIDEQTAAANPLLRRLRAAGEQWSVSPDVAAVDTVLAQHAAYDDEKVHAGYSLVRTFVWALPVLGLIGTVIGIAVAVGGFANFLGGDIDDISIIKTNLVGVTAGLSYAFLITLLGLATSLVLMLIASTLQTREEGIYSALQQSIADLFLPALQRTEAPSHGRKQDPEIWRDTMSDVARSVMSHVDRLVRQILDGLTWREERFHDQVTAALHTQTAAMADALARAAVAAGERLQTAAAEVAETFGRLEATLAASREQLVQQTLAQGESLALLRDSVVAAGAGWQEASQRVAAAVDRVEGSVAQVAEPQAALSHAIALFDLGALRSLFERHETVSTGHAHALEQAACTVEGLVSITQSAATAQAQLANSLSQLHESGLVTAVSALPVALHEAADRALATLSANLEAGFGRWQEASNGISNAVIRYEDSVERASGPQLALAAALSGADFAALEATFTQHDAVTRRHSEALESAVRAMGDLSLLTKSAIATQNELAGALGALGDAGLLAALGSLPESVRELTPVLKSFREPFVLQAVPVPLRAAATGQDGGARIDLVG